MGVYVKGVEMPDDCRECPFETYYNNCGITRCRATGKDMAVDWECIPWEGRAEWCPLVEVHTPHGRLCDADAVRECLEEGDDCKDKEWALMLLDWAVSKRTVIEAEDE